MLSKNILGAIIVNAIVFSIIGYGISLKISLDWGFYFKILASVGVIALIVSAIANALPSKN